jgi:hypothetical protein
VPVDSVVVVTSDGLPVEAEPPLSEPLRQRSIDALQELVSRGKVDLEQFEGALDGLLSARTEAEVALVVRSLPAPVAFTAPARRRAEPLEISTAMGELRLEGRWQVGRLTKINALLGAVTIDLSEAEFDDWEVEIVVHTTVGTITLVVPRGLDVRQVGVNGAITSTIESPIPGFPVVRLSATSDMGTIQIRHPKERTRRRWRWPRRRQRELGTGTALGELPGVSS